MSLRLDPRRLNTLRALAAEAGVRPGELVTVWVEERIDAERHGAAAPADLGPVLEALNERIEALSRRVDALSPATQSAPLAEAAVPRRRGRPPKAASAGAAAPAKKKASKRRATRRTARRSGFPLHDEIAAIVGERGPMTTADIAAAVVERGRYRPRSGAKPVDGTAVSVRVSNPRYRGRFTRSSGRIGLA